MVMGVSYPVLLGLWVAMVDLLPLVGGLLAGVPVVVIAAFHSWPALIVTAIVFLVYQQIENHVLNPIIMSRTVRLNPLWVMLAVLVGATLGHQIASALGEFVGALIGIPAGGAIQIVAREIRRGPGAEPLPPDGVPDEDAIVPEEHVMTDEEADEIVEEHAAQADRPDTRPAPGAGVAAPGV
jgi:predicted PurR-regulated permease PerM